jgi:hypothetical protein
MLPAGALTALGTGLVRGAAPGARPAPGDETTRCQWFSERYASRYDRDVHSMERFVVGDGWRWVGAQAPGDVLEIAVGTGRNLPYYAPDARLTGIGLSPAMLTRALACSDVMDGAPLGVLLLPSRPRPGCPCDHTSCSTSC